MKKIILMLCSLFFALVGSSQFKLFGWVRYKNTPTSLMPYLQPIGLSMQDLTNAENKLDPASLDRFEQSIYGSRSIITLDIETWSHHKDSLSETIDRYINAIQLFKGKNKTSLVGFYAAPPYQRYEWKNLDKEYSYKRWQVVNDSLKRFADKVDVFFPSAYCRDTNTVNWEKYIKANVSEIREKYSKTKPIYFYIDPQYIIKESAYGIVNHQFIDRVRWRKLLELIYANADGAVIWTSNKDQEEKIIQWDDNMEWWQETQQFLKDKHLVN